MRGYLSADTVANSVRMLRTQHLGSFLIVEGDTDKRFYERFVDQQQCQVIIAHNKMNALGAAAILDADHFSGSLTIVDADFDVLEATPRTLANVLLTDDHDVEVMLLRSPALEKVLSEFGSTAKLAAFPDPRLHLIRAAIPIGYLRWGALRAGLSLRFEDLPYERFIDQRTLAVDRAQLVRTTKAHSQLARLADSELHDLIARLEDAAHDQWHICCGHDLVAILAFGLRRALGTNDAGQVRPELIARSLRLAYEAEYFRGTRLSAAIRVWEEGNRPYLILAA